MTGERMAPTNVGYGFPSATAFLSRNDIPRAPFDDVEGSRLALRTNTQMIGGPPIALPVARDRIVGGVATRVYSRTGKQGPALIYLHGGGFVIGDLETVDPLCRRLAASTGCAVVSVDYRKAPEHPFPAAIEDTLSVIRSVAGGRIDECNPTLIAVAGDSAGGNIATVSARCAINEGIRIAYQVLIYPVVDHREDCRPSRQLFGKGFGLDTELIDWYRSCYLPDPNDWLDPLASPLLGNLSGHAPALVLTVECDALRDQAEEYAAALAAAEVPVVATRQLGELHGFVRAFAVTPAASAAVGMIAGMQAAWGVDPK